MNQLQKLLAEAPKPTKEELKEWKLEEKYNSLFLQLLPEEYYDTDPDTEFTKEQLITYAAAGAYNLDETCGIWLMCMKHLIPRLVLPQHKWKSFTYDELVEAITNRYNETLGS